MVSWITTIGLSCRLAPPSRSRSLWTFIRTTSLGRHWQTSRHLSLSERNGRAMMERVKEPAGEKDCEKVESKWRRLSGLRKINAGNQATRGRPIQTIKSKRATSTRTLRHMGIQDPQAPVSLTWWNKLFKNQSSPSLCLYTWGTLSLCSLHTRWSQKEPL